MSNLAYLFKHSFPCALTENLPVNCIPVGSADSHELTGDGNGCPEQVLPLLYPRVQEALLAEGGVHISGDLYCKCAKVSTLSLDSSVFLVVMLMEDDRHNASTGGFGRNIDREFSSRISTGNAHRIMRTSDAIVVATCLSSSRTRRNDGSNGRGEFLPPMFQLEIIQ